MPPGSWLSFITNLSGALTLLVAVIVAYIAYQQYKTNRDKLRLNLYDRRFELYNAFSDLCVSVGSSGRPGSRELTDFLQIRNKVYFLFDQDIYSYMELVRQKAIRLQYLETSLHGEQRLPKGPERTEAAEETGKLRTWFTDQFDVSREKFSRYLRFN